MIMKLLTATTLAAGLAVVSLGMSTTEAAAHGCHRGAQDGPSGWHRHVGPNCRAVASGPAERNPYARCDTRCRYVGPIKQCRRECDR
jgi:hypothetical protein